MKKIFLLFLIAVLSRAIYPQGSVFVDDFAVSEAKDQLVYKPKIAVAPNNSFAIAWGDERNTQDRTRGTGNIYAVLFSQNGEALSANFWADNAIYNGSSYEDFWVYDNSIIFLPDNTLIVAWHIDARASVIWGGIKSDDVYYTAISQNVQKIVPEKQLNWLNKLGSGFASKPDVAFIQPSRFLVVYEYSLNDINNIGGTVINAQTGELETESFIINDNSTNNRVLPSVASNGSNTVVVWADGRSDTKGDIFIQRFSGSSSAGSNLKVNSDNGSFINQYPQIAMNNSGDFIVVWLDTRDSNGGDIFAQRFDTNGNLIGENIKLTNSNSFFLEYSPSVVLQDNGNFTVAWTDSLPGKQVTAKTRTFSFSNGQPINQVVEVSNSYSYAPSGQVVLETDNNGKLYYSWLDGRDGNKGRIYAKVYNEYATDVSGDNGKIPIRFSLNQNYPNPFNPETSIQYAIGSSANGTSTQFVTLKIYDVLGKEVATLVNEDRAPGNYEVKFNGSNLASGVYFYRLQAGDYVEFKKMTLLK